MHINRVINNQYYTELYKTDYLKAYQARLDNKKALNEAIKTQNTTTFIESLSSEDAYSYLESRSNITVSTLYNFNTGISDFQQSLIDLSDRLASAQAAVYSYQRAKEEETEETEPKTIKIGDLDVNLILENEDADGSKTYSTDPNTIEISNYTVENLSFETFYDELGRISIRSSADLQLGSDTYEISLSENKSGDYIFRLQSNEYSLNNSDLTLYDVYLTEKGLEFHTDIDLYGNIRTIETSDEALLDSLYFLESQTNYFETGSTDSLIENSKLARNTILDEFITTIANEDKANIYQELLKMQITGIYEQDDARVQSSKLLAYLIK